MSTATIMCAVQDGAILGRVLVDGVPATTFTVPCRVATDAATLRRAVEQATEAVLADLIMEGQARLLVRALGPIERPVPAAPAMGPVRVEDGHLTATLPEGVAALLVTAGGVPHRVEPGKGRQVSVYVGAQEVTAAPVDAHGRQGAPVAITRRPA